MKRKVLIVTCEMIPCPGLPVTGGGLRVHGLAKGLESAGHRVLVSVPAEKLRKVSSPPKALAGIAHTSENLNRVIVDASPDILIFEQWGTATGLEDLGIPTVFDMHGSLSMENFYRGGGDLPSDALTKIETLAKADMITCAGSYQRNYFMSWFILAGADPIASRIEVIPVSLDPKLPRYRKRKDLKFVFSGLAWPWIDPFPGLGILARRVAEKRGATLDLYLGKPPPVPGRPDQTAENNNYANYRKRIKENASVRFHDPISHEKLLKVYADAACAFDLYERNPERELAITTRTVEYLWAGVPVIYGDYGELSKYIERYNAGFIVKPDSRKSIESVIDKILKDPGILEQMGRNAQKLVRENFTWDRTIKPLADFCEHPFRRKSDGSLISKSKSVIDRHWEGMHASALKEQEEQFIQEFKVLSARNEALHARVQDITQKKDEEVAQIRAEMRGIQDERDRSHEKAVAQLERELARREADIAKRDTQIEKITRKNEETTEDLRQRLDELNLVWEKRLNTFQAERQEQLAAKDHDLRRAQEDRDREIARRDASIAEFQKRIDQLKEEQAKRAAEVDSMQTEKDRLTKEFGDLKSWAEKMEEQQKESRPELQRLRDDNLRLENELLETRAWSGNLEKEHQETQAELQRMRDENLRLETELMETRSWSENLEKERNEIQPQLRKLSDERSRMEIELADTRSWAEKLEQDLKNTHKEMLLNLAEVKNLQKECRGLNAELVDTRSRAQKLEEDYKNTQSIAKNLEQEYGNIRAEFDENLDELRNICSEKDRLKHDLSEARDRVQHLDMEYAGRLQQVEDALSRTEELVEQLEENQGEAEKVIADREKQLRQSQNKIKDLEDERERLKEFENRLAEAVRIIQEKERALIDAQSKTGSRFRNKLQRKRRKLTASYPRLLYLFMVNLVTNFYMERWQRKHNRRIFPGQ